MGANREKGENKTDRGKKGEERGKEEEGKMEERIKAKRRTEEMYKERENSTDHLCCRTIYVYTTH